MSEVKTVKLWVCREVIGDAPAVALGAVRELFVKDLAEAERLRLEFWDADRSTVDSFVEGSVEQIAALLDKLFRLGLCGFTVDVPDQDASERLAAKLREANVPGACIEIAVVP